MVAVCAATPACTASTHLPLRRLLTSKAELESARTKIGELEVQVAELSDFNPAVLQQQVGA
jgi:hypothetical protein